MSLAAKSPRLRAAIANLRSVMRRAASGARVRAFLAVGPVRVLLRALLLGIPLLVVAGLYVGFDPFKVVWRYPNYYAANREHVSLNREYVSVETYKANAAVYNYDSFILGNSRSLVYKWKEWMHHIGSDRIIHLDASSESLLGIERKLKYLDPRCHIANCLMIVDRTVFAVVTNQTGPLFIKHFELTGQNPLAFEWVFFETFLDKRFFVGYFDMKIRHQFRPYMKEVLDERVYGYDAPHNELILDSATAGPGRGAGSEEHGDKFYARDGLVRYSPKVIGPAQVKLLAHIQDVLRRHHTNYRIVISPLYDQVRLAPEDMAALQSIFGNNAFDFSGINVLTAKAENYYETSHYRPVVASNIMAEIYHPWPLSASR